MIGGRLGLVARQELKQNFRRPMVWVIIGLLAFFQWGMASGDMSIQVSGDSSVGGTTQWLTGEFTIAQVLTALQLMLYTFFVAIAAGMTIIRDDELKVGQVLHGTPLTAREYIWGKFSGVLITYLIVLAFHIGFMMLFFHVVPSAAANDIVGPFEIGNYLRPALIFGVPTVIFLTGTAFAIGELSRKPILVFVLPLMLVTICAMFLWNWSPTWLDPTWNQLLMLIDPTGYRWLSEVWLKVDLGAEFYNTQSITFDGTFGMVFLISRFAFLFIGVLPIFYCERHFTRNLRASRHGQLGSRGGAEPVDESPDPLSGGGLGALGMVSRPISLLRGILTVARFETKELRSQPGLYLFTPFILSQTLGTVLLQNGAFDTPILMTSGWLAVSGMNTLTLMVCMLLMFYTVESQQREHNTNLAPIYHATAARTASIIFGKTIANAVVGMVVLLAALGGSMIAQLIQGRVDIELWPYLLVWGVLMVPTFMVWSAFITAVVVISRSRYTAYAVGIGVFIYTLYRQSYGMMNWVGNWNLWGALGWSDISVFELDRSAIVLNRVFVLGMTILLTAISVQFFGRRGWDASRIVHRLRPKPLFKFAVYLTPFLLLPVVSGGILWSQVNSGRGGEQREEDLKDYWKQNLATYNDVPLPAITAVEIDLELDPARQWFKVRGTYSIENVLDEPIRKIPLTGGMHWEAMAWTMNGEPYTPEDRSRLYVFTPPKPLNKNDTLTIGFSHEGYFLNDISKNGGGSMEFIVPSGVVITSFTTSFVPTLGFDPGRGVTEDNEFQSKEYADDFYVGITKPGFGQLSRFNTDIRISGPADFAYNAPGALVSDEVTAGVRSVHWKTQFPVTFFNVVAGRWAIKEGDGTRIFYHPTHAYNIEEMSDALDDARKYYSQWFMEYPWQELKLSEFPNLAGYAMGIASNITFSEGIGFLTRSEPKTNLAYFVVAHEAAHQWWGNLLHPGAGPGGNILSEGMAHFSTILLLEQGKGVRERIEFCKRIESRYGDARRVDAERPLVKIDGTKSGDTTVQYDKGGWVFWMLQDLMGRDDNLAGLQSFIAHYLDNTDFPVLQDFTAHLRPFAKDPEAFDAFVQQWFHEVVVPEYRFSEVTKVELENGEWEIYGTIENKGTGRMPLTIAAISNERFNEDGSPNEDYQESRITLTPTPGKENALDFTITCDFEPEKILVDPDAKVLQLNREKAEYVF